MGGKVRSRPFHLESLLTTATDLLPLALGYVATPVGLGAVALAAARFVLPAPRWTRRLERDVALLEAMRKADGVHPSGATLSQTYLVDAQAVRLARYQRDQSSLREAGVAILFAGIVIGYGFYVAWAARVLLDPNGEFDVAVALLLVAAGLLATVVVVARLLGGGHSKLPSYPFVVRDELKR